jgi:hypothetical protein
MTTKSNDGYVNNDGIEDGAQNHTPGDGADGEGVWQVRVNNALRAWVSRIGVCIMCHIIWRIVTDTYYRTKGSFMMIVHSCC